MLQSIRCCAVVVLVALPAGAAAQATFEGRVTAEMGGSDVVIISKDGKSRVETSASGIAMTMIMDYQSGSMTTLMPAQRMYMRMDLKQMEQAMRGMGPAETAEAPKFTRTGRRETIAGIGCEHVVFEAKDGKQMDVCAASGMGFFGAGGSGGGPMGRGRGTPGIPADYEQLMKEFRSGFFPLKMEMVEGTKRTQYMLVKQVERQRVDAAQFEVPAGYSEMKLPAMPPGGGRP